MLSSRPFAYTKPSEQPEKRKHLLSESNPPYLRMKACCYKDNSSSKRQASANLGDFVVVVRRHGDDIFREKKNGLGDFVSERQLRVSDCLICFL
jgi:hypothetical protein